MQPGIRSADEAVLPNEIILQVLDHSLRETLQLVVTSTLPFGSNLSVTCINRPEWRSVSSLMSLTPQIHDLTGKSSKIDFPSTLHIHFSDPAAPAVPNNPVTNSILKKFKHLTISLRIAMQSSERHPMARRPAAMGNLTMHYTYTAGKWSLSRDDTTWTSDLVHEQFPLRWMQNLAQDIDIRVCRDLRSERVSGEWIARWRRAAYNILAGTY